jgi:oxygen-independent coproporphyrinogen-3 oxidase
LRDIEAALALAPAHLSHYQLTLEPGTLFAARPPPLPDEDSAAAMLEECAARLAAAGFAHYEVSAYARPGSECRHNLNYWTFGDYLGIGAGAHGKLTFPTRGAIERTVQPREPRRYLAAAPGELTTNAVPAAELPFEFMLNALRLTAGFALADFTARTGLEERAIAAPLARLLGRGLLERTGEGYRASGLGLRFLNDVLTEFMAERPEMTGGSAKSIAPGGGSQDSRRPLFTGAAGAVGE